MPRQLAANPMERTMLSRTSATAALVVAFALSLSAPAFADGEILITQAKANAGNVTPGDAAGFPVTLSLPGSYEFASNLQPPADKAGIKIASNGVTINLNGFRLNGAAGATTGIYGATFDSATIRSGTITGFDAHGIYSTGDNWIVEDMRVLLNGAHGIYVGGRYSSVRGSTATQNGGIGIHCDVRCFVEESNSSGNGGVGISINGGTVLGNVIIANDGIGISGGFHVGYGNNTLVFNNGGGANPQVKIVLALHPNACSPACP
jgi:hypothetical protein